MRPGLIALTAAAVLTGACTPPAPPPPIPAPVPAPRMQAVTVLAAASPRDVGLDAGLTAQLDSIAIAAIADRFQLAVDSADEQMVVAGKACSAVGEQFQPHLAPDAVRSGNGGKGDSVIRAQRKGYSALAASSAFSAPSAGASSTAPSAGSSVEAAASSAGASATGSAASAAVSAPSAGVSSAAPSTGSWLDSPTFAASSAGVASSAPSGRRRR